jgi:hypothetical protein
MTDTLPRDQAALLFNATRAAARPPRPGETAWRLRNTDGRVQRCELRNDAGAGAGWDVLVYEGAELVFSRRRSSTGTRNS